jgi:hypothetical protein
LLLLALAMRSAFLALALVGCTLAPTPSPDTLMSSSGASDSLVDAGAASSPVSATTVDEVAVLASVTGGAFRDSGAFVRVTDLPFASAAVPGSSIVEWASVPAVGDYTAIAPDAGTTAATLPPGSTLVREVIDGTGAVVELTLLVKGPAGYNPTIGDWWWGVTDPDGTPETDDGGVMLGRLTQCYSCHIPRASDDYLFGAPADDRAK